MGPLIPLVWTSVDVLKSKWAALFTIGRGIHVKYSLRLTSGATPANLLAASMAAKPITATYLWTGLVELETGIYCATTVRQMLCRLSYAGSVRVRTYLRQITDSGWNFSNGHLLSLKTNPRDFSQLSFITARQRSCEGNVYSRICRSVILSPRGGGCGVPCTGPQPWPSSVEALGPLIDTF